MKKILFGLMCASLMFAPGQADESSDGGGSGTSGDEGTQADTQTTETPTPAEASQGAAENSEVADAEYEDAAGSDGE